MRTIGKLVPDLLMLGGVGAAGAGLYELAGLGWCLLVGGVLVAVAGYLLELGWLSRNS